ncbi:MAG: SDR family NAD(P)-dependent oxidoreductase [Acidobacteriota bacterium]|nr:SDR family NAD(P)-dependent oxidoreductase [Acidobacteriota bacterium]
MNERTKESLLMVAGGIGAALALREVVKRIREYDFRGRTVLITGGSRGLGLVLARELAHVGAKLAICARDSHELERARQELESNGACVSAVPCDVTDRAQVNEMVDTVRGRFGKIDVLINNAGTIHVGPMEEMTLEDYDDAMKTHFWGPLYTTLAVLPEMRAQRAGRIVNISSIGGKIGIPHLAPYSASKHALVGLSSALRAEMAKDGIVVTTVCPGLVRTGSPRNAIFKGRHRAEYAWFSISDGSPGISMSAERAARQIIAACRRGDAEVILTAQAQVAAKLNALFPELASDVLGLVNRLLLPAPGGIGKRRAKGKDSESSLTPSLLTMLGDKAAARNNEML